MTTTPETPEQIERLAFAMFAHDGGTDLSRRGWAELSPQRRNDWLTRAKRADAYLRAHGLLGGEPTEEQIDAVARELACLKPGEPWPTNAQLGGSLTGDRDVEYREGLRGQARDLLLVAARAARWQR